MEKTISFYNRYFIFKKVRNVNAELLTLSALNENYSEQYETQQESQEVSKVVRETNRKLRKTQPLKLNPEIDEQLPELSIRESALAEEPALAKQLQTSTSKPVKKK